MVIDWRAVEYSEARLLVGYHQITLTVRPHYRDIRPKTGERDGLWWWKVEARYGGEVAELQGLALDEGEAASRAEEAIQLVIDPPVGN